MQFANKYFINNFNNYQVFSNSCWWYSIQKHVPIKHKHINNINYNLEQFGSFIVKQTSNSYMAHFTCQQYAKSAIDKYHDLMNKIGNMVNVIYKNIDTILILFIKSQLIFLYKIGISSIR